MAVKGAAQLLDFLTKAFGAEEVGQRFKGPDGAIMHAVVRIGDSMVEVSDARGEPTIAALHMYVEAPMRLIGARWKQAAHHYASP